MLPQAPKVAYESAVGSASLQTSLRSLRSSILSIYFVHFVPVGDLPSSIEDSLRSVSATLRLSSREKVGHLPFTTFTIIYLSNLDRSARSAPWGGPLLVTQCSPLPNTLGLHSYFSEEKRLEPPPVQTPTPDHDIRNYGAQILLRRTPLRSGSLRSPYYLSNPCFASDSARFTRCT